MNNWKLTWTMALLALASCTSTISENDDIEQFDNLGFKLRNFVNQIAPSPVDKPTKITEYQKGRYLYDVYKYYNLEGNDLLDVTMDSFSKDTSHITTYDYEEGVLKRKIEYTISSLVEESQTFEYIYTSSQKLNQIKRNGENFEQYTYNQDGMVERITLGGNLDKADFYQFSYNPEGRIKTQIWRSRIEDDSPIRYWNYLYDDNGILLAKQVPDKATNDFKDMFVYKYDNNDRLIEIEELYPEFNFSPWNRTLFTYAP